VFAKVCCIDLACGMTIHDFGIRINLMRTNLNMTRIYKSVVITTLLIFLRDCSQMCSVLSGNVFCYNSPETSEHCITIYSLYSILCSSTQHHFNIFVSNITLPRFGIFNKNFRSTTKSFMKKVANTELKNSKFLSILLLANYAFLCKIQ